MKRQSHFSSLNEAFEEFEVYAYYITIETNKAWLEHSTGLVRYTYCLAFYNYFQQHVKSYYLCRLSN